MKSNDINVIVYNFVDMLYHKNGYESYKGTCR